VDLDTLDWPSWNAASASDRAAVVTAAAKRVGGNVTNGSHGPLVSVRGATLALVPGGTVQLGWDGGTVALDDVRRARWSAASDMGGSFEDFLRSYLGEQRSVRLAPFLIETTAARVDQYLREAGTDDPDDVEAHLRSVVVSDGFRVVSSDEWEAAARAGATGLFAWGDEWPDGEPWQNGTMWTRHREPNPLGITYGDNPYQPEIVDETEWLRHGDGGAALCGGRPSPEAWYTFALAFRHPRALWEDVVEETYEEARVRRALSLT